MKPGFTQLDDENTDFTIFSAYDYWTCGMPCFKMSFAINVEIMPDKSRSSLRQDREFEFGEYCSTSRLHIAQLIELIFKFQTLLILLGLT